MKTNPYESIADYSKSPCLFTKLKVNKRLTWEMTGQCNMGCKHCCSNAKNTYICNLSESRAKDIVNQMIDEGVSSLYISGGEPLLWDPLYDFISYSKNNNMKVISLATNGKLINRDSANRLKDSGIDKVLVSLDSHIESVHNKLRENKMAFSSAKNAIYELSYNNIFVRVGSIIWSGNVDYLEEMTEAISKMGVDEITFSWLMKTGRAKNHPELFIPKEKYFEIGNKLTEIKEKFKNQIYVTYHRFETIDKNAIGCKGGESFIHINPEGYVSPCSWIAKLISEYSTNESIFEKDFTHLVNHENIKKFKEMVKRREEIYGPGCPAICIIENGDIYSKDPLFVKKS